MFCYFTGRYSSDIADMTRLGLLSYKGIIIIMPPTPKKMRGILLSGCASVRASFRHFFMHAISCEPCMLRF